jgi:hypothetical protein
MQGRRKPFFEKIGFLLPCTPPLSKKTSKIIICFGGKITVTDKFILEVLL